MSELTLSEVNAIEAYFDRKAHRDILERCGLRINCVVVSREEADKMIATIRTQAASIERLTAENASLKARLRGGVLQYPLDFTAIDGREVDTHELARSIIETYNADPGSIMTLPDSRNELTGEYHWKWIPNDRNAPEAQRSRAIPNQNHVTV